MSLLLDSVLCALAPLTFLTAAIPELGSCTQHTLVRATPTHFVSVDTQSVCIQMCS